MEVKLDLHIHSEHSPDGRMALTRSSRARVHGACRASPCAIMTAP